MNKKEFPLARAFSSSHPHILLSSSLMITDHWVSANSHFHREEVGSSWSDGVALGVNQPSDGKVRLEEKQSIMGGQYKKITRAPVLREREDCRVRSESLKRSRSGLEPQMGNLLVIYYLLESFLTLLNLAIPSSISMKYLPQ